jgi:hypothetical protein
MLPFIHSMVETRQVMPIAPLPLRPRLLLFAFSLGVSAALDALVPTLDAGGGKTTQQMVDWEQKKDMG